MRLSEIKGEQTFDTLADIFESVCEIVKDKRVMHAFRKQKIPKGMSREEFTAQIVMEAATAIVEHKQACIKIMAALNGETEEEYLAQVNGFNLIKDVLDFLQDSEIQELFFSPAPTEDNNNSGSASGDISGQGQ